MGTVNPQQTPPPKKVRFAATPKTPETPRTGPGVPESVYRALLARPPHDPDGLMRDVCAFIEVRVGTEDVSSTFESLMTRLGATVRRYLGPSVTHVVFREGRVSTRKRALQLGIPIVGPLWVEECLAQDRLASPERFPAHVSAAYDCPILSRKIRKPRSWRTKTDSPSPVRRKQRPRLLDLRRNVLLDEAVLSPSTQHLQDIVTKVKAHVPSTILGTLATPQKREAFSNFPLATPGHTMCTLKAQEPYTPMSELAALRQSPLPELSSEKDRYICRRSLEDFSTNVCRARACALSRASWLEGPNIVLTGLEPVDRDAVSSIVKALGGFTTEAEVSDRTTHIICGTAGGKPRRTLSVLFALARGSCWLLPIQWAYQSLESGRWLDEGAFALSRPRSAVVKKRKSSGCLLVPAPLLDGQGPFYIGPATAPPPQRIRDLLLLLGAEVSPSYLRCQIALGDPQRGQWLSQITHLSERWLLDCVSEHQVMPYDNYLLQKPSSSNH